MSGELKYYSVAGNRAEFRPCCAATLAQGVEMIAEAIVVTRERGLRRLLLDITGLTGFEPPSVGARYQLMHRWADAAQGVVRVSCVSRPEMIDPQRLGVLAATNAGLDLDVFLTEEEALRWLERTG